MLKMKEVYNMKKVKNKKTKRKMSFLLALGAFALAGSFAITLIQLQIQISDKKDVLAQVQAQYNEKVAENNELERLIEDGSEDEFMERIARERLGYVKPGEKVYYDISYGS